MTTTAKFQTDILYPGGYGKCGIGTHDPYPGGIPDYSPQNGQHLNVFKVSLALDEVWNLIWNLEEWEVAVEAEMVLENAESDYGDASFEASCTGQFSWFDGEMSKDVYWLYSSEGHHITAQVLVGEPKERMCGRVFERVDVDPEDFYGNPGIPASVVHGVARRNVLLPRCRLAAYAGDNDGESKTLSGNIEDGSSNVGGNYSFTRANVQYFHPGTTWEVLFEPLYVRITGANACDVYFNVKCETGAVSPYLSGDDPSAVLSNNNSVPYPYSLWEATSKTFTILGQTVNCYVWHWGAYGTPSDLAVFSLNYAVTPTTLYTY